MNIKQSHKYSGQKSSTTNSFSHQTAGDKDDVDVILESTAISVDIGGHHREIGDLCAQIEDNSGFFVAAVLSMVFVLLLNTWCSLRSYIQEKKLLSYIAT